MNEVGDEMDPPAFLKARLKSEQETIKKRIMQEMEAMPARDKL